VVRVSARHFSTPPDGRRSPPWTLSTPLLRKFKRRRVNRRDRKPGQDCWHSHPRRISEHHELLVWTEKLEKSMVSAELSVALLTLKLKVKVNLDICKAPFNYQLHFLKRSGRLLSSGSARRVRAGITWYRSWETAVDNGRSRRQLLHRTRLRDATHRQVRKAVVPR